MTESIHVYSDYLISKYNDTTASLRQSVALRRIQTGDNLLLIELKFVYTTFISLNTAGSVNQS